MKGSRLFVKGSRVTEDADNIPDPGDGQLTREITTAEDVANSSMSAMYKSKSHMASASQESREVFRSSQSRSGLKTVHTQRVVRKTTTVSRGERKEAVRA